ncbi:hypothetical protein AAZV13_16G146950 [Glycine max]
MYLKRDEHFNHLNSHYCEDSSTSYKTTSSDLRAKLQTKCLEIKKENKLDHNHNWLPKALEAFLNSLSVSKSNCERCLLTSKLKVSLCIFHLHKLAPRIQNFSAKN